MGRKVKVRDVLCKDTIMILSKLSLQGTSKSDSDQNDDAPSVTLKYIADREFPTRIYRCL
jgi:hypothetical protein